MKFCCHSANPQRILKHFCLLMVCAFCVALNADNNVRYKAYKTAEPSAVKAALIFNFTRYVRWDLKLSENDEKELTVAFYQHDSSDGWLNKMADRGVTAQGCTVEVEIISDFSLTDVDVIVLPEDIKLSENDVDVLRNLTEVLVVTESTKHFEKLGMVLLNTENDQFYFEVHKGRLNKAGLTVNSRMLQAAEVVHDELEVGEAEQSS